MDCRTRSESPESRSLYAHKSVQVSLKWKALITSSVILFVMVGGLSLFVDYALSHQFRAHQAQLDQTRALALGGLIENAKRNLSRISATSSALDGMEQALATGEPERVASAFRSHWSELAVDPGLVEARFYSSNNRPIATFGESLRSPAVEERIESWVASVTRSEHPVMAFVCEGVCRFYAVAPLMAEAKNHGSALFASPLTDIVTAFFQVTKTDVALLLPERGLASDSHSRTIDKWNMTIPSMTNAPRLFPILQRAAWGHSLAALEAGVVFTVGSRSLRMNALPLSMYAATQDGYWLIIEDVSDSLNSIQATTAANWTAGLVTLAVAQSLLALLLWRPLSRLRRTAETLPMLGRGEFTAARDVIAARQRAFGAVLPDESDLLDSSATSLSYRLEALEAQVRRRTEELRQRAGEILQERDFGQRLLDTAPALILTVQGNGQIININGFGRRLLAGQPGEGLGLSTIFQVCAEEHDIKLFQDSLMQIVNGAEATLQHTSNVIAEGGQVRDIAWRHSRLAIDSDTTAMLSVGLDVTEQRRAERRVAWLADHDPLTSLFNRRRFRRELAVAVHEAHRHGCVGCLVYLDLDQFKFINDTAGHAVGDALLKSVAQALVSTVGARGITGRLSGDEFAVLLPRTNREHAIELANSLRLTFRQIHIDVGGRPQRISASIGIAVYPEHGVNEDDLLAIADLAMYQAKAAGRDGFAVYSTEGMGRQYMQDLLEVKTLVDEALAQGTLEFHYQPILDLATGQCSHVEALLRLRLQQGGHMLPRDFIGVAERTGAIRQIDNHVLRLAGREVERFAELGLDLQISINQSAFALADPFFYDSVAELARQHPSARGRLVFEITESAAVTDVAATSIALSKVRALGFQVALDDFGTGFSSLSHLKQLPVDYIKIDGVFVQDVVDKPDDQVLLSAVVKLATMYGKKTIAEHVSREDALEWVRSHGVDYAQGYVVARPMPLERLREFLDGAALAPTAD